ncbi:MAG TPA: hypothetical protein VHE54_15250 [Puia sp.]|nr:hypothetical protein [Puia sp.]
MAIEISVYPNPFDHYIMLEITCNDNIDCIVTLADIGHGRIIRMLGAGLVSGTNRIPFEDLEPLSAGNYQLEIKTSTGEPVYRTRLFKQAEDGPVIHLN